MGIRDLVSPRATRGMPVDDVLEGLDPELSGQLQAVLLHRQADGTYSMPEDEIIRECADDGFIVTAWSIRAYRKRNA